MKKTFLLLIALITLSVSSKAQTKLFRDYLVGTWVGEIKGKSTRNLLIIIKTVTYNTTTEVGTISGYSAVDGTNKTNFKGTFTFEDGYLDIILKEPGTNKTDGKFTIASQGPPGSQVAEPKVLIGKWKSYSQALIKDVLVTKSE